MPAVPFNVPYLTGGEGEMLEQILKARHFTGDGPHMQACQKKFVSTLGSAAALMTPSCSIALDLAMLVAGIGPGDEVLVPDFTFVTTAQCVALRGAVPVFCDIEPGTLNLDASRLAEALTPRTRAIIPVHYGGVSCDMATINGFARQHGLIVVEDAAQAVGATFNGQAVGSQGDMAAFSFHETKNLHCGEGGMLAVNRPDLAEAAAISWEKGTNRRQFKEGRVDKYEWVSLGSSYLSNEISAALLELQLDALDAVTLRRRQLWQGYHEGLAGLEEEGLLERPELPEEAKHNGHLYFILLKDASERSAFLKHMQQNGIQCTFHYVPLHTTKGGKAFGRRGMELANSTEFSSRLARLPMYFDLTDQQQEKVITAVSGFFKT